MSEHNHQNFSGVQEIEQIRSKFNEEIFFIHIREQSSILQISNTYHSQFV